MKILVPFLDMGKSGGVRVLSELCNRWSNMGHEVNIVTYFINDKSYFPINCNIIFIDKNGEVKDNDLNSSRNNTGINRIISIKNYLKKYSEEYDVVMANHNLTAWAVFLGSKTNNFYYIQAYEPEFYSFKGVKQLVLKITSWMTYFFPLKRIVNAEIYKNYKNIKSEYMVPPGLDLENYYSKKLSKDKTDGLIVGCIGRVEEWKGSNDVGEAVKILHDKGLNIKFKVAFNPVRYKNHELVKPDGDKNLADYYRSLDVLVAPGHIQLGAIHYPVIEAMSCNVPVITTGYYPANEKNSFIVPIKSSNEIANILEKIYYDYSIAIEKSNIAKKDILQFDWNIISKKFIDIFKSEIK